MVNKEEIRKKLLNELSLNSSTNLLDFQRTIYLLVLFRKILELDTKNIGKFQSLNFFSNWSLHTVINKKSLLIKEVESSLKNKDFTQKSEGFDEELNREIAWIVQLEKIISLKTLKKDIFNFEKEYGIKIFFVQNQKVWETFEESLLSLISSTPLYLKSANSPITKIVISEEIKDKKENMFLPKNHPEDESHLVNFFITLQNGSEKKVYLTNKGRWVSAPIKRN
tara:strand:- start:144251 stop:144922 length:672 start_codon:yes stop_codon:yes gene_type:complete